MLPALLLIVVFATSAMLTRSFMKVAVRAQIFDIPNARSSHSLPMPRGGGISIVVSGLVGIVIAWYAGWVSIGTMLLLSGGGLLVAGIGLIDDKNDVSAIRRFTVHIVAALVVVAVVGDAMSIELFGTQFNLGLVGVVLSFGGIIWHTNLFNFMDGIDGIAASEAVSVTVSVALLAYLQGATETWILAAIIGAATLGFLLFNWPPARIFMGDVGSGFLGFTLAALAVVSNANDGFSIWIWLILLAVFVVDATVTLLVRLFSGRRIFDAHRSHAYQHAAARFESHLAVTLAVLGLNVCWLLPIAWLVADGRLDGLIACLVAYAPVLTLAVGFSSGRERPARST